jgi:hypothetical protein
LSYSDRRFYLLPGACMAYRFELTGTGTSAPLSRSGSWAAFVTGWSR